MQTKTVYLFDDSRVFLHSIEAHLSPLEQNVFLEPVLSTEIAPPVLAVNEAAVFTNGAWLIVPDFRGQKFFDQTTGTTVEISQIGSVPVNLGATKPPPTPAQILADFQQSAQAALSATDATFARIQEAITLGLVPATDASVVAWIEYRKALRAEIKAISVGTLAIKPTTYPAGT